MLTRGEVSESVVHLFELSFAVAGQWAPLALRFSRHEAPLPPQGFLHGCVGSASKIIQVCLGKFANGEPIRHAGLHDVQVNRGNRTIEQPAKGVEGIDTVKGKLPVALRYNPHSLAVLQVEDVEGRRFGLGVVDHYVNSTGGLSHLPAPL